MGLRFWDNGCLTTLGIYVQHEASERSYGLHEDGFSILVNLSTPSSVPREHALLFENPVYTTTKSHISGLPLPPLRSFPVETVHVTHVRMLLLWHHPETVPTFLLGAGWYYLEGSGFIIFLHPMHFADL